MALPGFFSLSSLFSSLSVPFSCSSLLALSPVSFDPGFSFVGSLSFEGFACSLSSCFSFSLCCPCFLSSVCATVAGSILAERFFHNSEMRDRLAYCPLACERLGLCLQTCDHRQPAQVTFLRRDQSSDSCSVNLRLPSNTTTSRFSKCKELVL